MPRQGLPLDAELGRLVGGDLDDQRLDVDLRAAQVELVDDRAQLVVQRLGRRDDQRVGGGSAWIVEAAGDELPPASRRAAARPAASAGARAGSAAPPPAPTPARPATAAGDGAAAAGVAAAGEQRAQRLRDARGVGVLEVDDEDVAAGAARACRAARSAAARARRGPGCRRAPAMLFERASATSVTPLLRVGRGARGRAAIRRRGACTIGDQVDGRRVLQRHDDRLARRRLVERRDDPVDALQVVGVVGDDQRVAARDTRRSCCSA